MGLHSAMSLPEPLPATSSRIQLTSYAERLVVSRPFPRESGALA